MGDDARARTPPPPPPRGLRLRTERCESCLYRLKYDKATRDRILGEAGCTAVQLAIRLTRIGVACIEDVAPGDFPHPDDDDDQEEEDELWDRG